MRGGGYPQASLFADLVTHLVQQTRRADPNGFPHYDMTESPETSPQARVQHIAVGTYNIADRFPAYDEAFGHRLKNTAAALIESVALYDVAKTRDALGTNRLLHQILGHVEALHALLHFAKSRGAAPMATVEIVMWHLEQLGGYFLEADSRIEQHIGAHHPQGAFVFGQLSPQPQETNTADVVRTKFDTFDASADTKTEEFLEHFAPPVVNPAAVRFSPVFMKEDELVAPKPPLPPSPVIATSVSAPIGNDRQKRILDFFALRRRAQLKDILVLFPGISEKTIRNDLSLLCKVGNLRRVGLAPRSHYILTA